MRSWLKAGLIGGAVLAVLNLIGLIPLVGLVTCCLGILLYVAIGALAANWLPLPRQPGPAAAEGALAAGLAQIIGGIVSTIAGVVQAAVVGSAATLSQIPSEYMDLMQQYGLDPQQIVNTSTGPFGAILGGSMCCLVGVVIAAALGALGGLIWASMRPNA